MEQVCSHASVSVVVRWRTPRGLIKVLLIERGTFPKALACPAGHTEEARPYAGKGEPEEVPSSAAARELREEVGIVAAPSGLRPFLERLRMNNPCRRKGGDHHYWWVYVYDIVNEKSPELCLEREKILNSRWIGEEELRGLMAGETWEGAEGKVGLEGVWKEIFSRIGIKRIFERAGE